jgi:hypothetical protein
MTSSIWNDNLATRYRLSQYEFSEHAFNDRTVVIAGSLALRWERG